MTKVPAKISLDVKQLIIIALGLVVLVMLVVWKPWSSSNTSDRTVRVAGQAVVKAEPDEFVFYPSYQFKHINSETALTELTKKQSEIVSKLKALGVDANKIKTNANGNNYSYF